LNCGSFYEKTGYHILSEFGLQGEYLRRLSSEIKGGKFHNVDMIRDRTRQNLMEAMALQKQFALAVCNTLECRFEDNHIMAAFKVLGLTNMPSKQVGLANWGVVEFELFCGQYEVEREIGRRKILPLVNSIAIKRKFFAFELQATTDWLDKSFKDVWSMITQNRTLKVKYENLLVLAEIVEDIDNKQV
jgi:hypothetical protein